MAWLQRRASLNSIDKKLPVDSSTFVSAPNSLRLSWQSMPGGGWDAELRLDTWPNRYINFDGRHALSVALLGRGAACGGDADHQLARCRERLRRQASSWATSRTICPRAKWTRVAIPLERFGTASVHPFQPEKTNAVVFIQGAADGAAHTLLLDDIRIEKAADQKAAAPPAPKGLEAKGWERHVELWWQPVADEHVASYVIYRSLNGGPYTQVGVQRPNMHRANDFIGEAPANAAYKVSCADVRRA